MTKPLSWFMSLDCGSCNKVFSVLYKDLHEIEVIKFALDKPFIRMKCECPHCNTTNSMEFELRGK